MRSIVIAALLALPMPAFAADWVHDAGPMGQFGGFVQAADGESELSYGCALSSGVTAWLKGKHARAEFLLDGVKLPAPAAFGYQPQPGGTSFGYHVAPDANPKEKAAFNALLRKLSAGRVVVVETDTARFEFPAPQGQEILSCEIE